VGWANILTSVACHRRIHFVSAPLSVDALFVVGIFGSAIFNLLAHLALNRGLQSADASLVAPFLTFNPVFTLLIAIVTLQEFPTAQGIAGMLLVSLGANLVNQQRD
jgi:drug/metabolite transporter (DMT)-like permease